MFISAFFMKGAARSLFTPLALAVGLAMVASFVLSSTLVPVLTIWMLRGGGEAHGEAVSLRTFSKPLPWLPHESRAVGAAS